MTETSTTALLVGTPDMFAARSSAVTTTVPRDEIEEALTSEPPAELILEILRTVEGRREVEKRTVNVAWTKKDLESLLDPDADAITFYFDPEELERALEPDVEGHGLRETAVVLSIAAIAAAGASGAAYAEPGGDVYTPAQAAVGGHDETGLTARGIDVQPAAAVHDEATLAARGIESTPVTASHDEATLTARGIQPGSISATHDEATLAARGIESTAPPASHDEASLTARGIEPGSLPASHDEATLTARGIESTPAVHDEATLTARGIEPGSVPAIHDEATLVTRGIEPASPVVADDGFELNLPSVDSGTVAAVAGGLAGAGLLIAAAGFATRRRELGHP